MFDKPSGQSNAMTKMDVSEPRVCSTEEHPIVLGVKRWCREYNERLVKEEVLQVYIYNILFVDENRIMFSLINTLYILLC